MSLGFHPVPVLLLHYYIPSQKNIEYSTRHNFNRKLHHMDLLKAMGQISPSSHFNFCSFDEIVTRNEKVKLNIQSCYLNFFLDLIFLF